MPTKKLKHKVPSSKELWHAGFVLLQYAHRLETVGSGFFGDAMEQLMLSEVHHSLDTFFRKQREQRQRGVLVILANRLARVYEKVDRGQLNYLDKQAYRKAIADEVIGYRHEDGKPTDPMSVPGVLLISKKAIREERSCLEAATSSIAELYGKGERQIWSNRSSLKRGKLQFREYGREHEGAFYLSWEFDRAVMKRTLHMDEETISELMAVLKKNKIARDKKMMRERLTAKRAKS